MTKQKVLLIGWDAADWKIIGPLMAKGQMPALKKLIDKGVYGNMGTMNPPYSPMLWSSVATGKTPDKHGILNFIELTPNMRGIQPVTATSRKSRAIWNILHHEGYKSNVIGWWPSFPPEPINGVVVSDKFQKANRNPKKRNPLPKGAIHPESFTSEIEDLRLFPDEITEAHILPFIPEAHKIDLEESKLLTSFSKIMAENVSVHAAATYTMQHTEWDFMAVYYDMIDHFCHAFMKFHPPKLKGVPQHLFEIYNDVINGAYRFQDMMLERMMDLADDNTTIIVMSDHGYESDHKRILKMPKVQAAPALEHRQFGVFVAAGQNIKKNEKTFGLGLIDVAPTILHMFNLPIGKDMDGNIALDIFETPKTPKYIDSWESIEGDFGEHEASTRKSDTLSDQETLNQLIELGYIERPDEKIEHFIARTRCDTKHNLAKVYLGKGDYQNAKSLLLELITEPKPIDTLPYYLDLFSLALREKSFDEANDYLNKIKAADSKVTINVSLAESKLLASQGYFKKALKILLDHVLESPKSKVWFEIGKIYMQLDQFNDAKEAFQNALEFEVDSAKYHQAIAVALLRLGDYEEAAEHALTSIELVKFFPDAHYTLGEALEKMGDMENAKLAYETAKRLKSKPHLRAEKAIENIHEKITEELSLEDTPEYKYREDQIVIVSGLPRSGTSLMMQMLDKGGVSALKDGLREADTSNPKGYYEYKPVMEIHKDNTWLGQAKNKSLKVVAPLLRYLSPKYRYKVVFMCRDLTEIIKSQQKMRGKSTDTLPTHLFEAFKKQLLSVENWKNTEPNVELIYLDYKDVIYNTKASIETITDFIGLSLDKEKMASCIDETLYRNSSNGCSQYTDAHCTAVMLLIMVQFL